MANPGQELNIPYRCDRSFPVAYGEPGFLQAGDTATVTGWWVAHATNPLYEVTREDGAVRAIYREQMIEYGSFG